MKMYFSAALSSLYDPEPSQKVSADVVFVHGPGGSTFHSWIEDNTDEHWWKDWIQSLKVHTCGLKWEYSPEWLDSSNVDGLARSFWRDIGSYREKIEERPLIVIAHSWGGLIVKQALVTAPRCPYSSRLVRCVQGPIFLGTPHSSNKMHWRNILGSALELHPMGLPQSYKVGDETTIEAFAKISCAFRQVAAARTCVNICRSEWRNGCMQDEARPAVQQDAERQRILEQDYNGMHTIIDSIPPRIYSCDHEGHYFVDRETTKHELATILHRAVAVICEAFLTSEDALRSNFTLGGSERLTSRYPGTCEWILDNPQFRSWKANSGSSILWLHGNPGSGKTVLCSFIADQLRVEAKIPNTFVFFFHQRQDSVDPAKELLREIIEAIFRQSISFAIGLQNLSTSLNKTQGPLWPQAFRRYLKSIFGNVPSNVSVYLILDVLNKCNWVENVSLSEALDHGGQHAEPRSHLKCLFSSRNDIYVPTSWNWESRIDLDREPAVQRDVVRVINYENARLSDKFPGHRGDLNAVSGIVCRAQGCFLWARLVWNKLTRDIISSAEKVPTRLSHLPLNLDIVFQQCLSSIPSRNSILTARIFAWICCALRPLHLWELRDALSVGWTHASAFPSLTEFDGNERPNFEASLLEHCGGLVLTSNDQTLHLVHHSVKEFLLGGRCSSPASVFKIDSIQAQELLALTCLQSLICQQSYRGDITERTVSSQRSGIWDYAAANWAYHYRLAEAGSHYLTNKLQLYLQYSMKIQHGILTGSKQEVDISSNDYRNSVLKICLQSGFVGLAKIYLEMGIEVNTVFNSCGAAPLHLAVANGHLTVVDMLIKKGANLNSRTHDQGYTALHIAAFHGNTSLLLHLLKAGADPNEVAANSAETPLHRAAMAEDLDAVRLLLDFGAKPNASTFFMKKPPLNPVTALGRGEMVADLLLLLPHAQTVIQHKDMKQKYPEQYSYLLRKIAYFDMMQGRYEAASTGNLAAFEIQEKIFGLEHPETLMSMANLASTYRKQGRLDEAEKLEVQVMEASLRVLGADHPTTLTGMGNLASTYRNQGRWVEAEKLDVQVLETRLRVLKAEHPDTLISMANLASTNRNQGRWDEAEKLDVQVLETRLKDLGAEHPITLISMANLASTYRNQGRWDEAEKLDVQVMETSLRLLKTDHPDILTSMANLASTYRNQGRWNEAEKLDVQVMEMRLRVLKAEHPSTLNSMANLALTYRNQRRWDEAEKLQVQVMETRLRVLKAEHPSTLNSMANLASTYRNQGQWDEAEKLQVQVMEKAESCHDAVRLLLKRDDVNVDSKDDEGCTPLSWAADVEIVRLLLEMGMDVNGEEKFRKTALHRAAANGALTVVRLLLEKGADLGAKDSYGRTALQVAAEGGHEAVVRLLLENGADIEAKTSDGWTTLQVAAKGEHEAVVRVLLDNGANIEAKTSDGWTALQVAAKGGHKAVVRLLLDNGANLKAKTSDRWMALQVAPLLDKTGSPIG